MEQDYSMSVTLVEVKTNEKLSGFEHLNSRTWKQKNSKVNKNAQKRFETCIGTNKSHRGVGFNHLPSCVHGQISRAETSNIQKKHVTIADNTQHGVKSRSIHDSLDISTSVRRNLSEQRQLTSSEKDNNPLSPSNSKPSGLFNSSVFEQLIEDNFVKINLEDELLALGIGLRQFEHNKYQELRQVVNMFNETQPAISNGNQSNNILKLTIERIQSHTEKWIKSLKFISSFNNICLDDQVLCIKSQFVNLCIVSSLGIINPETKSIQRNGINFSMEKCPMMRDQRFINLLSSMDSNLRMDPIINVLLVLIHLFNSSTPNLTSNYNIRKEYIITVHLLQKYLEEVRGLSPHQANLEISKLIGSLNNFLIIFKGKQKVISVSLKTIKLQSQLLSEILEIID